MLEAEKEFECQNQRCRCRFKVKADIEQGGIMEVPVYRSIYLVVVVICRLVVLPMETGESVKAHNLKW